MADRFQLRQVFVNLAVNAVQAMAQSPRRSLFVESVRDGSSISVTMQDAGPGLQSDDFGKVFESLFTTKDAGMGMGLRICRSIVEARGGLIAAGNGEFGGACFVVTLPIVH